MQKNQVNNIAAAIQRLTWALYDLGADENNNVVNYLDQAKREIDDLIIKLEDKENGQ